MNTSPTSRPARRVAPERPHNVLLVRTLIAAAMIALGCIILSQMVRAAGTGGFAILPGVILGVAMVALGVHRLMLILRVRRMP